MILTINNVRHTQLSVCSLGLTVPASSSITTNVTVFTQAIINELQQLKNEDYITFTVVPDPAIDDNLETATQDSVNTGESAISSLQTTVNTNTININNLQISVDGISGTISDLSIRVNPTGGSDITTKPTLFTQAEYDAHGAFATVAGVIACLPAQIKHAITITIDDGNFTINPNTFFGDFTRLIQLGGYILVRSNSLIKRTPGTSTYNIASLDNYVALTVTLSTNPGFTPGVHIGKMLNVVSGSGNTNRPRPISSHTGATITIAGRWDTSDVPNTTTVVEIVECSTKLSFSEICDYVNNKPFNAKQQSYGNLFQYQYGPQFGLQPSQLLIFSGIEFYATNTDYIYVNYINIDFDLVRISNLEVTLQNSSLAYDILVLDGKGTTGTVYDGILSLWGNSMMRGGTTDSTILIINTSGNGLLFASVYGLSMAYLIGVVSINNCGYDAIYLTGHFASITISNRLRGSNINGHTMKVIGSSRLIIDELFNDLVTNSPVGSSGAIILDNVVKSYADLANAPTQYLVGSIGSVVVFDPSL